MMESKSTLKRPRVDIEDPVGEYIAENVLPKLFRMNVPPKFVFSTPIVSNHNLDVLQLHCKKFQQNPYQEIVNFVSFITQHRPSIANACRFALFVIFALLCITGWASQLTLKIAVRSFFHIFHYLFILLIDWDTLSPFIPSWMHNFTTKIRVWGDWIDNNMLLGHRFAGREWDEEEFVFDREHKGQSTIRSLWDLPPPSKNHGRRLCLDPEFLARPDWSKETLAHVVAIDFCYIMLREANLRKKAKSRPIVTEQYQEVEILQSPASPGNESVASTNTAAADLPWIDLGAKIGLRLLNSAHVQRAMNPETANRLLSIEAQQQVTPLSPVDRIVVAKPVHTMWTSPTGAAVIEESISALSPNTDQSPSNSYASPRSRNYPQSPPTMSPDFRRGDSFLKKDLDFPVLTEERSTCRSPVSSTLSFLQPRSEIVKRKPLQRGMKVAVPLSSVDSIYKWHHINRLSYQMGTVESSERIYIEDPNRTDTPSTNAVSIKLKLDRSFLRNGEFAELSCRVLDRWPSWCMPRHSKVPIGSCVATSFGIGILVSWRVEDDCHVVRSLWNKRGSGSAHAYLRRDAIYEVVEAAIGFKVETKFGVGKVLAYVDGGRTFQAGQYIVQIHEEGRRNGHIVEMNRSDIVSCRAAQFIPVVEHIREAAHYQIQLDNYRASMRESALEEIGPSPEQKILNSWSQCAEILWASFLKAMDSDKDFNAEVNDFMTHLIDFLERLDEDESKGSETEARELRENLSNESGTSRTISPAPSLTEPGLWILDDVFGGILGASPTQDTASTFFATEEAENVDIEKRRYRNFRRGCAVVNLFMNTISIARAASPNRPHFRMALAIFYDFLLFIRTVIKVQETNTSTQQIKLWRKSFDEIVDIFGPIKNRIEKIGLGIAQRLEKQGRQAKVRLLRFVDYILGDERLLLAMEQAEWGTCLTRIERALVLSSLIEEKNVAYYRKTLSFILEQIDRALRDSSDKTKNEEKLQILAQITQWMATPRRSVLKLLRRDDVLQLIERILVRAFEKEELASRMLSIHASNFQSLRHLRLLKDFSTSGSIWMPLLDAADEEFSWLASQMPDKSKEFMCPLSSLFSLCVAQFRMINEGDLSKDWLDFLLEDDAVRIVQEIDMKAIQAVESFAKDIKKTMVTLPYYATIDEDILKLVDEVDINEFLKEASEAIDDPERLATFIQEKARVAIERFLNYLPTMSIPVTKHELGDGWVISCRSEDGRDLTLSDLDFKQENLVCQVVGGDALAPVLGDDDTVLATTMMNITSFDENMGKVEPIEESILDHIREMILSAQRNGCWIAGVGGVHQPPSDRHVAAVLQNLPITSVLNCAIDLWRSLEIDDDELLEIAIRDVSYNIELHGEDNDTKPSSSDDTQEISERIPDQLPLAANSSYTTDVDMSERSFESARKRFNPRIDPTVLYFEMRNVTLKLEDFLFRIEKAEQKTIFDPIFEGHGALSIENLSLKIRVHVAKQLVERQGLSMEVSRPALKLHQFEVKLDHVALKVRDTGFGSDWLLNRVVAAFSKDLTDLVQANLRDEIHKQIDAAIDNLNSYFLVNPDMILDLLGISMEDLGDNIIWI